MMAVKVTHEESKLYLECCPFCGPQEDGIWNLVLAETKDVRDDYILGYTVYCPACEFEMNNEFMSDLLEQWNKRFYHEDKPLTLGS
jgi:hypothetical protein